MKPLSLDNLRRFFNAIKEIFASKEEVQAGLDTKVTIEEGKGLSSNDFTDYYKNACETNIYIPEDGANALMLRGPDNRLYRLKLDDNMRLVLDVYIKVEPVNYLLSNGVYYSLTTGDVGEVIVTAIDTLPEGKTAGIVRAARGSSKYNIMVEDQMIVFEENNEEIEGEAKYIIDDENPNKLYYFTINDDIVYANSILQETNTLTLNSNDDIDI